MEGSKLIEIMKENMKQAKAQNFEQFPIKNIEDWVLRLEEIKANLLKWIEEHKHWHSTKLEILKAAL